MDHNNIDDLGVIVNDREGEVKELTTDEAIIPIRVPDAMFDRFVKAAHPVLGHP